MRRKLDNIMFKKTALTLLFFMFHIFICASSLPAWYQTTGNLNLRYGPSTSYNKAITVSKGTELIVNEQLATGWSKIEYQGNTLYAKSDYLSYVKPYTNTQRTPAENKDSNSFSWLSLIWNIAWPLILIQIIRWIMIFGLGTFSQIAYKLYWILNIPFYCLNWLQRHLSKPWRIFYKHNSYPRSWSNEKRRETYEYLKIPIYVLLTPLRFVNAVYYNILVHTTIEFFNYTVEVLIPSSKYEGEDNIILWYLLIPWRILRYPIFHGALTITESIIWTIVDTIMPALTLYHGTCTDASINITQSHIKRDKNNWYNGIWNVGGGNYAGNGIYFAPTRSTALHYSSGALIITRVSLGRVLDLGLAPYNIYAACGHPNALCVTSWGLKHNYTTGEWWRQDEGWWEYCMYDWQNKYNESWRIRPLYVLNLEEKCIQRIPGGMYHWLFSPIVIKDILRSIGN